MMEKRANDSFQLWYFRVRSTHISKQTRDSLSGTHTSWWWIAMKPQISPRSFFYYFHFLFPTLVRPFCHRFSVLSTPGWPRMEAWIQWVNWLFMNEFKSPLYQTFYLYWISILTRRNSVHTIKECFYSKGMLCLINHSNQLRQLKIVEKVGERVNASSPSPPVVLFASLVSQFDMAKIVFHVCISRLSNNPVRVPCSGIEEDTYGNFA